MYCAGEHIFIFSCFSDIVLFTFVLGVVGLYSICLKIPIPLLLLQVYPYVLAELEHAALEKI